ncbi:hypothetical protein [Microvirga tunisiensis]|uniref:hypothetical protein n=1 Tax=Microvirga tunisiensis TaxID=2108360 RepID=UPI00128DDC50|nr:hypothetical protein [Microvirga tunisiensis]MPR09339.1 hypothetical protein [Microvirga tunisiensis]
MQKTFYGMGAFLDDSRFKIGEAVPAADVLTILSPGMTAAPGRRGLTRPPPEGAAEGADL